MRHPCDSQPASSQAMHRLYFMCVTCSGDALPVALLEISAAHLRYNWAGQVHTTYARLCVHTYNRSAEIIFFKS